ncbi:MULTISPECIES: ATP-binding protein [Streptomyces]|uniref:ATP-binding protein n=1 Tax=Streptomyces lichenis TaxID=2306967 RepID=A0ABT0I9M7_9ACTN|nr:ATP-binding protein [Streptomyces lichenis]MCK8678027.1 ATP-binding protein [Streptomyces lichenis]
MTSHQSIDQRPVPQPAAPGRHLTMLFSSTRRGARLARRLAVQQFTEWTGLPHGSDAARAVAQITGELASNAVTHGRLPGRDFRLRLSLAQRRLRIEVTDARPERAPRRPVAAGLEEGGRGLLMVAAYAEDWGWEVRDRLTKTVWAEVAASSLVPEGRPQLVLEGALEGGDQGLHHQGLHMGGQ